MGFFTRAAMDALMKTTHPEINRRQCWNLHPHRKSCTACKDICPYGDQIFTRPNLVKDWDPCTDCGLCVSVCRSRCISPSPEQVERDTSAAVHASRCKPLGRTDAAHNFFILHKDSPFPQTNRFRTSKLALSVNAARH